MSDLNETEKRHLVQEEERSRELRIVHAWKWYFVVVLLLFIAGCTVLFRGCLTSTRDASAWNKLLEHHKGNERSLPNRGNIYSDGKSPLAITVPMYDVRLDFRSGGFNDSIFLAEVDGIATTLAKLFPKESKESIKKRLKNGYRAKSRSAKLVPQEMTHMEFSILKEQPYFKGRGAHKTGLTAIAYDRRVRPYGSLAMRTIGGLQRDADSLGITHGNSGLEMAFDSLLCGKPGVDKMIRVHNRYEPIPKVKPQHGLNIYTTLNVDIQDITERSLRNKLIEVNADWGTAVVMEVKTGEIKAISNLDRMGEGVYQERTNHALADLLVPGSTFKAVSMLIALNEGYCSPEDTVDVGNGVYHYARGLTIKDHNAHKGGYGKITLDEAMWYSSNIGVAKTVLKGFEGENKKYLDRLNGMNVFDPIDLEIPGTAAPRIKQDASTWSKSTLPWTSFGYELEIPPIYTLRFYNAIANNGKMMEPYLVRSVENEEEEAWSKKPKVVNKQIASKKAIKQMQAMLRGVVTEGTGRPMNSIHVDIAGKTGTTQIYQSGASWGGAGHVVTFCGYFPAHAPQYSAIVVVCRPRGVYPAGSIPGAVLVDIAEQTVATTRKRELNELHPDSLATFAQHISSGLGKSVHKAIDTTNAHTDDIEGGGKDWLQHTGGDSLQILTRFAPDKNTMPNVQGMATADAIYLLEKLGLRVRITGEGGYVRRQSVASGKEIKKGQSVLITL